MWLLSLDELSGDSYGTYLMKCDFSLKDDVENAIDEIIEGFKKDNNNEWSVDEIASQLSERGFDNEFMQCVHVDV